MRIDFLRYGAVAALLGAVTSAATVSEASRLVILHTNDTHSQIDAAEDGLGGILRRKVLIDSVRAVEPNVVLVDAGDAVQGTLFFTLYGGEVENRLMDSLHYDFRILGNHEFDNGTEQLAQKIAGTNAQWLTSNYLITDDTLKSMFRPYAIRNVDGRNVGFIALNLNPKGMISDGNYDGIEYIDPYQSADALAWLLRNYGKCDVIVAITHVGYAPDATGVSDTEIARRSKNIDVIIGGHSHTVVDPAANNPATPAVVPNVDGKPVVVAQTGKSGRNLGQIVIDLDSLNITSQLIPVDARLDNRIDTDLAQIIAPYRAGVDSLMNVPVTRSARALPNDREALLNFVADYIKTRGNQLAPGVDFAITNRGGIRRGLPEGTVTQGMVIQMLPFNNRVVVIDIKGADLMDNFDVMARTGGNGLSDGIDVAYDPVTLKATKILVNGKQIDPERTYRVATIDYLANGGDYMQPLTHGVRVAESNDILSRDILQWLKKTYAKRVINPIEKKRMYPAK